MYTQPSPNPTYLSKKGAENYNMKVYKRVCWDGKYMSV